MAAPRLGIAITTMNRRDILATQIAEIRRLTTSPHELVICDDGSSDGTQDMLGQENTMMIGGFHRGIAWNKNRGIYYLMVVHGCDVVILLDDDMLPTEPGWEQCWVEGAARHGHVNFIYPGMVAGIDAAACTAETPGLSPSLLGACIAFHRQAWGGVGFIDPCFGKYGHEHTEFTNRFIRTGFGGVVGPPNRYCVIGGSLKFVKTATLGTVADAVENAAIWRKIEDEAPHTYRAPWCDEAQRTDFLAELDLALRIRKIPGPRRTAVALLGPAG